MKYYGPKELAELLPYPPFLSNKYTRGKCVLVGGSQTYPGAVCLAARASQRMGAGYTEVFTDESAVPIIQGIHPSLVVRPWSTWDTGVVAASTPTKPVAYVMGCGFDYEDGYTPTLTRRVLRAAHAPVVVDGGALRILSARKMRDLCAQRYKNRLATVITPHMGEASQLASIFGLSCDEPDELCLQLAQAYGVWCVLKGPDTFISDGEETLAMRDGTPALAKAGTGDVLSGMIGSLLAQGLAPMDACVLGTTLHARAGWCAQERLTPISVCAEDVIESIPQAITILEEWGREAQSTTEADTTMQAALSSALMADLTGPYNHSLVHAEDEDESLARALSNDEAFEDAQAKMKALESLDEEVEISS